MSVTKQQLMEIGSWRLATEMLRHYPKEYLIVEMHPGGGQYDCLTVLDKKNPDKRVYINRCGSISIDNGDRSLGFEAEEAILGKGVEDTHKKIFAALNIPVKKKLPPSTETVLIYRFISTILSQAGFGKDYWECRSGYNDSSGWGGCGPETDHFKLFPEAQKRATVRLNDDLLGVPHYRFWFILKNKKPVCCLETAGLIWNLHGEQYDVMKLYKKYHRLWPIVWKVIGDKLD